MIWLKSLLLWWIFSLNILTVHAESYIETSSLLTCMKNSQVTASYFNVVYTPNDTTVVFDVSAITTLSGYIRANIQVIVYGLNVVEKNFSACDLGFKTMCPISAGRIDVSSNYKLGSSVTKQIPGIGFNIPDLDAKVRVTVYPNDTTNNTAVACVEAILTNGKTVQTRYASWPIAAISGLGLITSGVVSVIGHSNTAAHIASNSISLFVYFQNVAITSMMAVTSVPPIASAWCQNFQWSMGIIHVPFLSNIANWYVQSTGGTATSILSNKKVLSISVQKKLLKRSGYKTLKYLSDLYERSQKNGYLLATPKHSTPKIGRDSVQISKRSTSADLIEDSTLYNTDEKNTTALTSRILILKGIQRVSFLANIEITSLFFTGMIFTIFFSFVLVVCLAIFKAIIEVLIRSNIIKDAKFSEYRTQWRNIIKGALYRLFLIGLPQVVVLSLWELTERDSVACIIMAVVLLVTVLGILIQASVKLINTGRESARLYQTPAYSLYGDSKVLNKYGFLYVSYNAKKYWWVVVSLTYIILRSIIIALLQSQGKAQAVIIFVFELAYFVAICVVRPFMDKRTNVFNIMIHLVNFINSIFFLIFSNVFGNRPAVNSISGVVLFVVNAVFSLVLLIFTIVTCVMALRSNPDKNYAQIKDDRVCFIKKTDGDEKHKGTELAALGAAAARGHEDIDLNVMSMQSNRAGEFTPSQKNNGFEDDDYDIDDKFPSSRLPANDLRPRSNSIGKNPYGANVVEPGSLIYNNHGVSGSTLAVSKPSNIYNDSNTGYGGLQDNNFNNSSTSNSYPYNASGSSTNMNNPYGGYRY